MSTATVNPSALNGNGHAILTPLTPVPSIPTLQNPGIHSPSTHIDAFHQNSHNLAMAFSQVPWMKFSIVAQPDLNQLASNEKLKGFVHHVTSMTIATVSQKIHEEITAAVNQVIKNIASTVNERMTTVHAGIMQEIIGVSAEKTATDYERLGVPPFDQLLKDITGGNHHDCHCSVTGKTTEPEPKPTVIPTPATPKTTTAPATVIKPTTAPVTVTEPTTAPVTVTKPASPPVVDVKPVETKPTTPATAVNHTTLPPPSLKTASWIWSPEYKKNPKPAVGHTRAFRRTIVTTSPVNALTLEIVGDDMYTVYVNGKLVGSGSTWNQPDRYSIRFEPTSRVVVAVLASQGSGEVEVGLIAAGKVWNSSDVAPVAVEFATDATWLTFAADGVSDKFIEPTFVDAAWSAAHVVTLYGARPWPQVKPTAPGKAAGQRISGKNKIPDAPMAPVADEWKF